MSFVANTGMGHWLDAFMLSNFDMGRQNGHFQPKQILMIFLVLMIIYRDNYKNLNDHIGKKLAKTISVKISNIMSYTIEDPKHIIKMVKMP